MKKTISINIGGNIFHIEEEGYDKLKSYLDSVHSYFATFEDSKEIIDDIENRIAEKFYSQLKKNKEAISTDEVDKLIASMGTVADFEATIDEEPSDQKQKTRTGTEEEPKTTMDSESRRLYRDSTSKILGGVAAGIAHYFKIDPLWIRLLWILLLLTGFGIIAYIIFWVVLPERELEDTKSVKKFYRDPDGRVLGGVASGISSFFSIDAIVVRVLFIASIFLGGSGLILYIILWIITPEARTVTEKMEMKGEPVTMAGIEKNVKKSLNIKEGDENVLVKILLFPFRLIAMVFEGLGRMLGPVLTFLVEAVRVVFGAILVLTGFSIMVSLIFTLLFLLGLDMQWDGNMGTIDGVPIIDLIEPLSPWGSASAFFLVFIPALGVALLGLTIILKRSVGNVYVTITMVVIWFAALMGALVTFPRIVGQFSSDDSYEEETAFRMTEATPELKLNDIGHERYDYEGVDLRLRGHEDDEYMLVVNKEAWGSSRKEARENAQMVNYTVEQLGNDFFFDSRVVFDDDAKFRFQNVDVTFYIPYGKEFTMDQELDEILVNTLHLNGYKGYQMGSNTWKFDEGGILCVTCTPDGNFDFDSDGNSISFQFEDFDEVRVSASYDVNIYQSDEFDIRFEGRRGDLDQVIVQQSGDRLTISHEEEDEWRNSSKDIEVHIYMPELSYFRASGECRGDIENFDNRFLEVDLSGETDFDLDVQVQELDIDLSGGAKLEISGDTQVLAADLSGASYLNSNNMDAEQVTLATSGNTTARVFADDTIAVSASGESRVTYRGTSNATVSESGNSRVRKD